jgi:hypothetical protein
MATHGEEKNLDTKVSDNEHVPSLSVRFDLEGSHQIDDFEASVDEVDDFLELSTASSDITPHVVANGSTTNTKILPTNNTTSENKSTLRRYKR